MTQSSDKIIKNYEDLAKNPLRRDALEIAEAGLVAIDTEKVIFDSISLKEDVLAVKGRFFNLKDFKKIKVLGFGKVACQAALALEKILGSRIQDGVVIGSKMSKCDFIKIYKGDHPRPSQENVKISQEIYDLSQGSGADDLVLVIISGGGSSMLCWPEEECEQSQRLYDKFLECGDTIKELNIVRAHISKIKGGGLAKALYPATVVGLVFSDIPGDHYDYVASGPTYKDSSTVADAQAIIDRHNLGKFDLSETPKEDKYFEKVQNIVLVSNSDALQAMALRAKELGYVSEIISTEIYDEPEIAVGKILSAKQPGKVVLAGGEPTLIVKKNGGSGGRCSFVGLNAVPKLGSGDVFIALASDGLDNGEAAGVVVEGRPKEFYEKLGLNWQDSLLRYDSEDFFKKLGDLIRTGPTGSNVSDLMILLTQK